VTDSTTDQLRKENNDLRDLVVQLSNIILRNVVGETRALPQLHSRQNLSSPPSTMSPIEIVPRMREVALLCAHLSRDSRPDSETARELESLGVELADAAERLAAIFFIPDGDREGGAL
jgi:hypothetical protein